MNEIVAHNPIHVWIEPTTRCNTRCRHCQHFYSTFGADMSAALYEKIRDAVLDDVRSAELIGYGEPLMSERFDRMADDCAARGVAIRLTTNGLLLNSDARVEKLVRAGASVTVSVDGARPETFEFVRPHMKWSRMVETLKRIQRVAQAVGAGEGNGGFELRFCFVPMKANIADLPALVGLASAFGASEVFVLPLAGDFADEAMKDQSLHDSPELVSPAFLEALRLAL